MSERGYGGRFAVPVTLFGYRWRGEVEVLGYLGSPVVGGRERFRRLIVRWCR